MLNFIFGRGSIVGDKNKTGDNKNTRLAEYILAAINQKKEVFLVVAKQFTFETERTFYELLGANDYNKMTVCSFDRLAETILEEFPSDISCVAELQKSIFLYMAIKNCEKKLLYFGKLINKADFLEKLLAVVVDLVQYNISPAMLAEHQQENPDFQDKINDIMLIYMEYLRILGEKNLNDNMSLLNEVTKIANVCRFFQNKVVCFDEFDFFDKDQLEFFRVILSQSSDVCVTLPVKCESTPIPLYYKTVEDTYTFLKNIAGELSVSVREIYCKSQKKTSELEFVEKLFTENGKFEPKFEEKCSNFQIVEALDVYDEAEYVCAVIKQLTLKDGYKYSDITVITRNIETYSKIFKNIFRRYEIPFFVDVKENVAHTSVIIMVTALLELLTSEKFTTENILRYLKTEFIGLEDLAVNELEEYCYKWNITDWNLPFRYVDIGDYVKSQEEIDKIKLETQNLEELRQKIINPLRHLKKSCKNATVTGICTDIFMYLGEIGIDENITKIMQNSDEKTGEEIKFLWNNFVDILDTFVETFGDVELKIAEFTELFSKTLKGVKFAMPPQIYDGVKLLDASRTRLIPTKITFVIGVNEEYFPKTISEKGLFSPKEKRLLSEKNVDFGRELKNKIADEYLVFYKSFTNSSEKLFVTYPISSLGGDTLFSAAQVKKLRNSFPENVFSSTSEKKELLYCITPNSSYHYFVKHYSENLTEIRRALMSLPEYRKRILRLEEIAQNKTFKIQNTKLIENLFTRHLHLSQSSFESYIVCPFKFFCRDGLKIYERGKKEFTVNSRGTFIHYCLQEIFTNFSDVTALTKKQIYDFISVKSKEYLDKNYCNSEIVNQRFVANFSIVADALITIVENIQDSLKNSQYKPVEFELEIAGDRRNKPLKTTASNGILVSMSGKIDRVDVMDNFVRVIDYKSGKKELRSKAFLGMGLDLQMFFYIFAITESGNQFEKYQPAEILYLPAKIVSEYQDRFEEPTKEETENFVNSFFKPMGYVLGETNKITGQMRSLTQTGFQNMREYVKLRMREIAVNLYNGDISALPLDYETGKNSGCKYCNFADVCGNFPNPVNCVKTPVDMEIIIDPDKKKKGKKSK